MCTSVHEWMAGSFVVIEHVLSYEAASRAGAALASTPCSCMRCGVMTALTKLCRTCCDCAVQVWRIEVDTTLVPVDGFAPLRLRMGEPGYMVRGAMWRLAVGSVPHPAKEMGTVAYWPLRGCAKAAKHQGDVSLSIHLSANLENYHLATELRFAAAQSIPGIAAAACAADCPLKPGLPADLTKGNGYTYVPELSVKVRHCCGVQQLAPLSY